MGTEKPLSENDKIELARQSGYNEACFICEEKVKKLKEEIGDHLGMGYRYRLTCKIIDKIFGEELSK